MDIEDIMNGGIVFGKNKNKPTSKKAKKKLSGSQQKRADYHARIAARNAAQQKKRNQE